MKKFFLTMSALLSLAFAKAQKVEGLIVTVGSTEQAFAISEIKEIAFGDDGMTILKTDEAMVSFNTTEGWQIRFGEVEPTSVSFVQMSVEGQSAKVYGMDGILVKECLLSEVNLSELPKGIYIIMCNGKTFKVQR